MPARPAAARSAARLSQPSGQPEFVEGGAPSGGGRVERIQGASTASLLSVPQPEATGTYPSPFTQWEYNAMYRNYPVSTIGKLFFTQNGGNYVCSAASAAP